MHSLANALLYLFLFFLPFQSRWIFDSPLIGGAVWEYGTVGLYVTQVLLALCVILRLKVRTQYAFRAPILFGAVFVIAALASALLSKSPIHSAALWVNIAFAYVLFVQLLDRHVKTKNLLFAFVLGLIIPLVLGLTQAYTDQVQPSSVFGIAGQDAVLSGTSVIETESGRELRAYGTFPHPNVFGGYAAVGAIAIFILSSLYKRLNKRLFLCAVLALDFIALIYSYSRSAWLALALSAVIASVLLVFVAHGSIKRALPAVSLFLILIAVAVSVFAGQISERFDFSNRLEQRSISERVVQIREYPQVVGGSWPVGLGFGMYTKRLSEIKPGDPAYAYQPVHNSILLSFAESGAIAFIFLFAWIASIDRFNYSRLKNKYAIGALAMGNCLLIISLFDHYLWSLWSGLALAAFVLAMTLRLSDTKTE